MFLQYQLQLLGLGCDCVELFGDFREIYLDHVLLPEYTKQFKAIEFAVYCPSGKPTDNYDAFKSVLGRK